MNPILRSYFFKEIKTTMMATGLRVPEPVVAYTADLLAEDGLTLPDAIFDLLDITLKETSRYKRLTLYKKVGDCGLILGGVFRPFIEKKGISISYYNNISVFAYRSAQGMVLDDSIYRQMEDHICVVSDLLSKMIHK